MIQKVGTTGKSPDLHSLPRSADGGVSLGRLDDDGISCRRYCRRALWPEGFDLPEPRSDFEPEKSRLRVFSTSQLLAETIRGYERNRSWTTLNGPTLPYKPHIKVQDAGCVRQCRDGLALHGNAVLVNLMVECLAEHDFVLEGFMRGYMGFVAIVEPKVHTIKKV